VTKTRRDIVSGAVFAVAGITLYRYAAAFPVREGQAPAISAGFYPKLLAFFLGVLAVIQIVTAVVAEVRFARGASGTGAGAEPGAAPPAAPDTATTTDTATGAEPATTPAALQAGTPEARSLHRMPAVWKDRNSLGLFLFTVIALVIYPFLLRILGFTVTGLLFLGSLIVALSAERRRGKDLVIIIAVTIGIGILTYFVFRRFLQIPFPAGIFGR